MMTIIACILLLIVSLLPPSSNATQIGNGTASINRNRGYVLIAPKRLIAGETQNVCLSLHNLEPPVNVSLDLLPLTSPKSDEILAAIKTHLKTGVEICLELRVSASTKYSVAKLRLRLKFEKYPDYSVETEKKIYIEHDTLVTFVETDKAIYKPGQDVLIRILSLKHDLRPCLNPIPKVWIESPSEVRVGQWTNVSLESGMVQLSFPLSDEPTSGTWKVKVEKSRAHLIQAASFEVKKYVLPRFQVTIGAPGYILADATAASWKICVRYSYGKPVKGKLSLSLRPQTPIWKRKQPVPDVKYEEQMVARSGSDGCTNYTVSGKILGLGQWKLTPSSVVLLANFTEDKTAQVETASSRSPVLHQPLRLEFAPHTPKHFKPGLPYHGKLRVLRADASSPAPNEKIQVCLRVRRKDEWQRTVVECRNFTSPDPQGFLDFIVPPQQRSVVLLSFVATAVDYPTKYYSPDKRWRVFVDQPSAYVDVEPWYSPSQSYLSVTRANQPIVCGEKYSFNVMYTSAGNETEQPVTFHYSINSKGDLLIFGHVKYKPRKDTLLDYSEFPNVLAAGAYRSRTSTMTTVHRFPLSVRITASMAPISELLLYYVRSDGELVSASYSLELPLGDCFDNRVKTTWHEDSLLPGSTARFHIEAAAFSLCGVSAVDKSTRFLSSTALPVNLLQPQAAFARLKSFHLQADGQPVQSTWAHCDKSGSDIEESATDQEEEEEEIDHLPKPVAAAGAKNLSRVRRHSVTYNVDANYVDAIQAFDNFGTIVMSDLILESRPCPLWRSGFGRGSFDPNTQEDIDEPDRMLKAVKAMPLAFQFGGSSGSAVIEAASVASGSELQYLDPAALEMHGSVRSYFPETWIWDLVPTGKDGKTSLERKLPDSITDWIGNTVCVSAKHGLGISSPVQITAFQPFFLDSNLPYSVRRGEQLRFKISLFNYMQHSLPVTVRLVSYEGFDLAFNGTRELAACVPSKDSFVHEFPLVPRFLGDLNVTVAALIDIKAAPKCAPELPENLLVARDEIVKAVKVKAEGFPVELTRSAFLCPKDFSDDSSLVWEIELPPSEQVVEGSARASVTLSGDVLGPALENLDRLVKLPMGCGEQNMILFVPNIHVIAYLDAVNWLQPGSELRAKALRNMRKGYQRELNYRHTDGSYSAFGPGAEAADSSGSPGGSMWLTAFVVKSFAQARSLIQIDERDLKLSVKWIVRRQLENGCFPVVGQIFHKDMKGGLRDEGGSSSAALTAYVLVALLESGVPLSASLVNNALYCLEKASSASSDDSGSLYGAALTTYALALLEHPRAEESLRVLLTRANRQADLLWWEDKGRPSLGLSIETTAYGILSMLKILQASPGDESALEALRAVRWMSKKRNAEGGFSSTQDTVLGLEALSKFALAMSNSSASELSVLVTAADVDRLLRVNERNRLLLQHVPLGSLPTSLEVFAEGEGCLLVQSSLIYNKPHATGSEAFDVSASAESITVSNPEAPGDLCAVQRLTICARYKLPDEESNMVVMEVDMATGFRAERDSLHDLLQEHATGVKRFEENEDTLAIYFDKLTSQKTCVSFRAIRDTVVENARPSTIKLYDYYQQELTIFTSYEFVDPCTQKKKLNQTESSDKEAGTLTTEKVLPAVFRQRSIASTADIEFPENMSLADAVDEGSGTEDSIPGFVDVDHELETPSGVEGPPPVYVEAPSTIVTQFSVPINSSAMEAEDCPQCLEELPSYIRELFCSSSSAVKVAIRRSRRARLLLDLSSSSVATRLRATLDLNLRSECSCPPIDKPGIMALILSSKDGPDLSKLPDKAKALLSRKISIFSLLPVIGTPEEIKQALIECPRSP